MPRERPLVSIIVPVYNAEPYLAEALDSALAQSYRPAEIIVVDDGSTDGSAEIAQRYLEVRYFHQANQGASAARNLGVRASHGGFLAFLDADDRWTPNKLDVQIGYLLSRPQIGLCYAHQRVLFEPGVAPPPWFRKDLIERDHPCFGTGILVVRRIVFEQVGEFDPGFGRAGDTEWLFRAKDAGIAVGVVPETVLIRRVHAANVPAVYRPDHTFLLSMLKRSIDRSRDQRPNG